MSIVDPQAISIKSDPNLDYVANNKGSKDPRIFQMPFHSCPTKSEIIVELKYMIDLTYEIPANNRSDGGYLSVLVPLTIPNNQPIYDNYRLDNVLSIISKINTLQSGQRSDDITFK